MDWQRASTEWLSFLDSVRAAREKLYCSINKAWFRGHSNCQEYKLVPTLFRQKHRMDPDHAPLIHRLEANDCNLSDSIVTLRGKLSKARAEHNALRRDKGQSAEARNDIKELKRRIHSAKQGKAEIAERLRPFQLLPQGERDAYVEFHFRSGNTYRSSWECLADMRHCGIPTRLLDWTETLSVALYFALSSYRLALAEVRDVGDYFVPEIAPEPSIWIMNPYHASQEATSRTRIWDLTLQNELDYFERFVVQQEWEFEKPVPMYSPWTNARMASQQGTFTVFGHSRKPLNKQMNRRIVREVRIPPLAAVYGLRHLDELCGFDRYTLFRDADSLAESITQEYLS